jgi:hypothetical protein
MKYQKGYQYERNKKMYVLRENGYTYKNIGEICGVSTERVRQIVGSFGRNLRREIKESQEPKQLNNQEYRIVSSLVNIIDDIKNIAEK